MLVERILAALRERVPVLRSAPVALVADVHKAVEESTAAGLRMLLEAASGAGSGRDEQRLAAH